MKISNKLHKFLFGWREGTIGYLGCLLITFGGTSQLFDGVKDWLDFVCAFVFGYYIFIGVSKVMEFCDKWNQREYTVWRKIKND